MKENQRIQKFKMYQIMKQISKMNQKLRTKVEKMPKIMKKISKINRKFFPIHRSLLDTSGT